MKLLKKLVIMTGKGYEKGTFTAEKNAVSVSCRANLHNLRNLSHQQYLLAVICNGSVHFIELGNQGTATKTFMLPYETDISSLHCVVAVGETIALYGTSEGKKMWEGNIIDILRRRAVESKKDYNEKPENTDTKAEINHCTKEKNIRDYFLDIVSDYNDEAVAEINYFGGYSAKPTTPPAPRPKLTEKYYNRLYKADALYSKPQRKENFNEQSFKTNNDNIENKSIEEHLTEPILEDCNYMNNLQEKPLQKNTNESNLHNNTPKEAFDYDFNEYEHLKPNEAESKTAFSKASFEKTSLNETTGKSTLNDTISEDNLSIKNTTMTNQKVSSMEAKAPSKSRFKDYYDGLKEKYGYNKNVLTDYTGYSDKRDAKKDEPLSVSEQPATHHEIDNALINSVKIDNGEHNLFMSDKKEADLDMKNLRANNVQKPVAIKENQKNNPPDEKKGLPLNTQKLEEDYETKATGQDFITPILEAASTMNIKKAPPLESSFSRIRLGTFYEQIKDQIDFLFKTYAHSEELEKIIPDSKWVRVDYNNDGKYYVIGIIGKPDYICYGVPAVYTPSPPVELEDYCQWLPLDISNPTHKGYWLLFQDAVSGESIKNEII